MLGVHPLAVRVVFRQVHPIEHDETAGQAQRRSTQSSASAARCPLPQPVDDHLDLVVLVLLQLGTSGRAEPDRVALSGRNSHTVDAHTRVPHGLQFRREQVRVLSPFRPRTTGASTSKQVPSFHFQHQVHDLLLRSAARFGDRRSGSTASPPQRTAAKIMQSSTSSIVPTVDRASLPGTFWSMDAAGKSPSMKSNIRLVHQPQELARVRGQKLERSGASTSAKIVSRANLKFPGADNQVDAVPGVPRQIRSGCCLKDLLSARHERQVGPPLGSLLSASALWSASSAGLRLRFRLPVQNRGTCSSLPHRRQLRLGLAYRRSMLAQGISTGGRARFPHRRTVPAVPAASPRRAAHTVPDSPPPEPAWRLPNTRGHGTLPSRLRATPGPASPASAVAARTARTPDGSGKKVPSAATGVTLAVPLTVALAALPDGGAADGGA